MDYLSEVMRAAVWGERPPDAPIWIQWIHRNLSENHCPECLKLDECWFAEERTPRWPHHPYCHCVMESVPYSDVLTHSSSHCPYSKFDPYLFDPENLYQHKKNKAFESWGYSVEDSRWLQNEIAKQGLEKYRTGEYALGKLNKDGQRISIRVEIPRKDREGTVSFITGWMVYPNGEIRLNTPYGGK